MASPRSRGVVYLNTVPNRSTSGAACSGSNRQPCDIAHRCPGAATRVCRNAQRARSGLLLNRGKRGCDCKAACRVLVNGEDGGADGDGRTTLRIGWRWVHCVADIPVAGATAVAGDCYPRIGRCGRPRACGAGGDRNGSATTSARDGGSLRL